MGYETSYLLTIIEPSQPTKTQIIADLRSRYEEAAFALAPNGETNSSTRWYEYDKEMKEFSRKYPLHIFILDGIGEDGEHIRTYFKNGKSQDAKPVMTYEPFDEEKLK